MYHILFNPIGGNGKGAEKANEVKAILGDGEVTLQDVTKIESMTEFIKSLPETDKIVVCGGDGTLNHFANDVEGFEPVQTILYYPAGTGNDFARDIADKKQENGLYVVNEFIKNLPHVIVNGTKRCFINGIGFGIDGYCCEVGDQLRAKSDKPVNYAGIAIKGLLFYFKRKNARITVDGQVTELKKVWMAPTMKGRYYGGGMIAAPDQDRTNPEGTVTFVSMYGKGKIKTLMVFPSIFKGEHVKHTEMVKVITGKNITVEFDEPCALQIDGETVLNVTKYEVVV